MNKIDKENKLIKLTVGQVCSAGVAHNIYTGDSKCYAVPFQHKIWENNSSVFDRHPKNVGLAIRITNDGEIVGNPNYAGNAIIAFLDQRFENCDIHSVKIVKVNRRSVNVEPVEFSNTLPTLDNPSNFGGKIKL